MLIAAAALDCGRMLWDMGSRNKVKILKGEVLLLYLKKNRDVFLNCCNANLSMFS